MRIAVDAMGGDNAPEEIINGSVEAIQQLSDEDEILLFGPEEAVKSRLSLPRSVAGKITVIDAPDIIEMDEGPVESLRRKRNSSIAVMAKMAANREVDGVISAGNTGACVAAFQMRMRTLPGVNRPGIAVVFPTFEGPVTICDVGANIACKPINLYQYAVMSIVYAQNVIGIENPRVGLMSIGEEEAKGNEVVKKAQEMLRADEKINFVGNIEGRDIFKGACDVAVCEGFVGNVVLKLTEGLVDGLFKAIKHELMQEKKRLALKFKPVMQRIYKKYDYNEYGGAPLLGINGLALICHGSSKSITIQNAVFAARKFHTKNINDKIQDYLSKTSIGTSDERAG